MVHQQDLLSNSNLFTINCLEKLIENRLHFIMVFFHGDFGVGDPEVLMFNQVFHRVLITIMLGKNLVDSREFGVKFAFLIGTNSGFKFQICPQFDQLGSKTA